MGKIAIFANMFFISFSLYIYGITSKSVKLYIAMEHVDE